MFGQPTDTGCHDRGEHHRRHCDCDEKGVRLLPQYLRPFLLLLLSENPTHGYELMENLGSFGFAAQSTDPTTVYRQLRRMEGDGLVRSSWDTSETGPAKRLYDLTPEGEDVLDSWAVAVRQDIRILENFLHKYNQTRQAREG